MKNFDVCVFGGCSLDMTFFQKSNGAYDNTPDLKVPGGKGSNQAVAASRAGAKTTIITKVGKDDIGKELVANLERNMIDISNVEMVDGLNNDYSTIKVRLEDKDNEISRVSGAINSFTPDLIDKYSDTLINSKIIVSQLKVPKEVTEKLINFCYENNKMLVLTPCRPEKLSLKDPKNIELIEKISLITCNQKECETIFGTNDVESCVKQYPNKLIVTLGKNGAIYHNGSHLVKLPAIDVDVVDTVGAGDTLNGNLCAFLASGLDLYHALRKAMYASAMKIQVPSAQNGMPYKDDLENFILKYRNKNFDYSEELNFAIELIKKAYNITTLNNQFNVSIKDDHSLVTNLDIAIEELLISNIKSKFKNDIFLTEEINPNGELKNRTWIIDPIDGTCFFVKGSPYWGIQLAFYDKLKTRFSIIYLPEFDELYYAAHNQGAFVNNNRILRTTSAPLNQSVVEFGGSTYKELNSKKLYFHKLVKDDRLLIANLLHINACCISFTNLVSGKTDALITASKKLWDIMPGLCLLEESGIQCYSLNSNLKLFTANESLLKLLLD